MQSDIERRVFAIQRPAPQLMTYYVLQSILLGPLFFIPLIPLYFRYHTMRYRFDHEGITMRWGILLRREITLTYARVQDIHLTSNFVERWLGLARIQIQTASASAEAEMTIEGLHEFEMLRDFLYTRMRGVQAHAPNAPAGTAAAAPDLAIVLASVASELHGVRVALERLAEKR